MKLIEQNEFSKTFRDEEDNIDLFVQKGGDDETNQHYLIFNVPLLESFNVGNIQYPVLMESEEKRNEFFDNFQEVQAIDFIVQLIAEISKRQNDLADGISPQEPNAELN